MRTSCRARVVSSVRSANPKVSLPWRPCPRGGSGQLCSVGRRCREEQGHIFCVNRGLSQVESGPGTPSAWWLSTTSTQVTTCTSPARNCRSDSASSSCTILSCLRMCSVIKRSCFQMCKPESHKALTSLEFHSHHFLLHPSSSCSEAGDSPGRVPTPRTALHRPGL